MRGLLIFEKPEWLTEAELERGLQLVTAERRAKAMSYLRGMDRRLSVIAELLLLYGVGRKGSQVRMEVSDTGKPQFADSELPCFSLSHCDLAVACAISDFPVGVDVEPYSSYDAEVAAVVFNAQEQQFVGKDEAKFAELWTVKESLLKFTGEGLTDDLPGVLQRGDDVVFRTLHSATSYACTICRPRSTENFAAEFPTIYVDKNDLLYGRHTL